VSAPLDEIPIDGPLPPPDTDPPPPSEPSVYDLDADAEFTAIEIAWEDIVAGVNEDGARFNLAGHPLLAWLFAACSSGPYEGAEGDPPAIGILRGARETVEGWADSHNESTIFAEVSYADLGMLARRLDAAIMLVKVQTSILLRRAEKAEQTGGAS
jgi:hypothetical protein